MASVCGPLRRRRVPALTVVSLIVLGILADPSRQALAITTGVGGVETPSFVENRGQWARPVQFAGHVANIAVVVFPDGVALRALDGSSGRAALIRFTVEDALAVTPVGESPVHGVHNYFVGSDPLRWESNLRAYAGVLWPGIRPGVDLRLDGSSGAVVMTLHLAPGTPLDSARFRIEGGDDLSVTTDSRLVVRNELGPLHVIARGSQPGASAGPQVAAIRPKPNGRNRFGFHTDGHNATEPLVVNLGLEWATYLGGSGDDFDARLCLTPSGDVVVASGTNSLDFPLTPGVIDTAIGGSTEVSVSRLDPAGEHLIFATYLGGSLGDVVAGVGAGLDECVTVFGHTLSGDFPITAGAFDTQLGFFRDFFLCRLSPDGRSLQWSTYVGGTAEIGELAGGMVLHSDESVYVVGRTTDWSYPVTFGAFETTPDNPGGLGPGDIVVSHIRADGAALLQSTFLRGSSNESAVAVALAPDGVVVVGDTSSSDFPTSPGAYDGSPPGRVVAKLDFTLSNLLFSTVLSPHQPGTTSFVRDVAVDPTGNVTVVGYTNASWWPVTPGAFDTTYGGQEDGYVTRFNPTGSALVYSTYIGAGSSDGALCVSVDSAGVATIGGFTDGSAAFPKTSGAWDVTPNGDWDSFVLRLSPDGGSVWYGTYLGGASMDSFTAAKLELAERPDGRVAVTSVTLSADFPVTEGAYDTTYNGTATKTDLYVAQLSMLPTGVARFGNSTNGCAGYLAMGVSAMPQIGKAFTLTCRDAPPSSTQGMLAIGLSDLSVPLMAKGAALWVNPIPLLLLFPWTSNTVGFASVSAVLPNDPGIVGATFTVQSFWPDPCAVPGPLAASNALAVTLHP
jgi:hypothetical protein